MICAGVDAGSRAIKIVLLDSDGLGVLADFGIKSVVIGEKFGLPYPVPTLAKLQVFESQAKRAEEILKSNRKQEQ